MFRHVWLRRLSTLGLTVLLLLVIFTSWVDCSFKSMRSKEVKIRNKRDGTWSEWSPWGPCSRTCGGGIRTQARICQIRKDKSTDDVGDDPRNYKNVSSRHCEGHAGRHHICNLEECPGETIDFRESQCKAFDNRAYMGKVYSWEAFVDERTPCALTCRAKGFRFFATLNKSVIDGTPCNAGKSPGINPNRCISGLCMAIGCDGIAGSQRRLDRCGVCGGDNTTCRVVSGIFTRPQLPVGYNLVAHIPRGACNVNITQLRKSANRLALRNSDGTFILNGEWRLSWPGMYEGAGTKFYYTRQEAKLLESIVSAGPLNEPLDLMVLYQQPNHGIKYEYMLPLGDSSIPPVPLQLDPLFVSNTNPGRQQAAATYRPTSYVNPPPNGNGNGQSVAAATAFNTISSFPIPPSSTSSLAGGGSGQIYPHPHPHHHLYPGDSTYSNRPESPLLLQPHGGNHHQRRRGGHHLNNLNGGDKKFYWKIVGYTNCSEPCGGGTQRTQVRCVKSPAGNPVSDRRCAGEEKPEVQAVRCNLKPCPAEWDVGSWSSCSEACGQGVKSRAVFCQQKISPTLTMRVNEGACLKVKPEPQTNCFIRPCHRWDASEWSQCSAKCGNGVRRRSVICLDEKGKRIETSDCDDADRPTQILPCNMGPCEGTDWFVSDWSSECSQMCGGGVQTRHVLCSGGHRNFNFTGRKRPLSSEAETNSIEDEDEGEGEDEDAPPPIFHCDESRRPEEERECFSEKGCGDAAWFSGEWSECSAQCGDGVKTRQVLCVLFSRGKFKVVEDALCSTSAKPEDKTSCESNFLCSPSWFSSEWTECSVLCGGGVQRRYVSCRSGNWTKTSSFCADVDRPLDKRSCNEHKCSKSTSDASGMVKDNVDTGNATLHDEVIVKSPSPKTPPSTTSRDRVVVEAEADSDPSCQDQYRNCGLVHQARLCRYKYYKGVCCKTCSEALSN